MKKYAVPIILFIISIIFLAISIKVYGLDFANIVFFNKASTFLVLALFTFTISLVSIWIIKIRDYYK